MCPQAEGRLREVVDVSRRCQEGTRENVNSVSNEREGLTVSCDRVLDSGLQWPNGWGRHPLAPASRSTLARMCRMSHKTRSGPDSPLAGVPDPHTRRTPSSRAHVV